MLTKSGGEAGWNAANERSLTADYRASRIAQRQIEGLSLPHGPDRTLTAEQVRAVLDDDPNLWRLYVQPRCEHLVHTAAR
jgi:hypothetical protein